MYSSCTWLIYSTLKLLFREKSKIHVNQFSSVSQSCPTLRPHGLQHAKPPCPSPTLGVYSNSCPLSRWCHPPISSSIIPFSSCLQSFPASVQFSSVTQSCPSLWDPMNCSTPGLPVHHQLPESTQIHVHWIGDGIQQAHPLSSPSPSALNLS